MEARRRHAIDGAMGEAVGKLYVAKYFTPEAKAKIDTLVHNLLASMGGRIDEVDVDVAGDQGGGAQESWRRSIPSSAIRRSGAIIRS